MALCKQASKRSAQNLNNSTFNTPTKAAKPKISKLNETPVKMAEEEKEKGMKIDEIHGMLKIVMTKLEKLDVIEERIKSVEEDMKGVKHSIEFAHAEIKEIKEEQKGVRANEKETRKQIEKIEAENAALRSSIVDLKARSMRDNQIFFNIPECERENTTATVLTLLEEKFEMKDATVWERKGKRMRSRDRLWSNSTSIKIKNMSDITQKN